MRGSYAYTRRRLRRGAGDAARGHARDSGSSSRWAARGGPGAFAELAAGADRPPESVPGAMIVADGALEGARRPSPARRAASACHREAAARARRGRDRLARRLDVMTASSAMPRPRSSTSATWRRPARRCGRRAPRCARALCRHERHGPPAGAQRPRTGRSSRRRTDGVVRLDRRGAARAARRARARDRDRLGVRQLAGPVGRRLPGHQGGRAGLRARRGAGGAGGGHGRALLASWRPAWSTRRCSTEPPRAAVRRDSARRCCRPRTSPRRALPRRAAAARGDPGAADPPAHLQVPGASLFSPSGRTS